LAYVVSEIKPRVWAKRSPDANFFATPQRKWVTFGPNTRWIYVCLSVMFAKVLP